ncbi:hypothetical protein FHX42_002536 [Saccharopolyspora lacisalsi]|uniref:ATP synthase protein I n=1 Tax=Halosaccharopolyspora lacisalsi TaxID=1000566 RepID=A0A839E0I6_9PSEU|nr:hypothetical protein [Halosaccharopolyspora lacisalsi]MBA8825185.1 hypothetical protein [Halosaccharopolyspora lacisalsi]
MSDPADLLDQETKNTTVRLARAMVRPAMTATLLTGGVAVAVAAVVAGVEGVLGAVFGTLLVIGCCWINVAVMRWMATSAPLMVMAAALGGYCTKFSILLTLLLLLADTTLFDMDSFALAILATVVAWTAAEVVGFTRARVPTVIPARDEAG